jgi:hypothetical protein
MFQQFKHKFVKLIGVALVLVIFVSACNIPSEQVDNTDALVEKAMQTLQWQQTLQSVETKVSQLTQVAQQTEVNDALPTQTPYVQVVTATSNPPTQTPYVQVVTATSNPPTQTPYVQVVTATPNPPTQTPYVQVVTATLNPATKTATTKPVACNSAQFIKDVTIPDFTELKAGETFTKTWRVTNVGSCTWTTAYNLVFSSGNAMNASAVIPLTGNVAPGQAVDLSVTMKAPESAGDYSGYWMLRNQNNALFGVGSDGMTSLWVKIKVKTYAMFYNFADKACDASWGTPIGSLACPGDEGSVATGYVVKKTSAKREDGVTENELSLVTRPNAANDGVITGFFPVIKVKDGDQFRAVVNCEYNSAGCDVTFKLKYQIGGGDFVELGSWHEVYEGKFNKVLIDLSTLAGKDVKFVLYVKNNNTATNNKALWVLPSIWRLSTTPISTTTPVPPTSTPGSPTKTTTPVAICNIGKFVKDVTIPDGTEFGAGATFTKTWRIQNVGTCTWTTAYDLVFVSGSAMNAPAVIPLTANVAPGQTVDLSVTMKAPDTSGDYTGFWMLRNQNDARFGVGANAATSLWVKIKVKTYTMVYNFANKACDATWGTPNGALPCPGDEANIATGYVVKKTDAKREDGVTENELSLVTRPNAANDGVITGHYPVFRVQAGDQFRAVVNCEYNSPACDVTFKLKYQIGGGAFLELGSWHEIYEGKFMKIVIDLTPLAGKDVKFVLYVKNNNIATDNKALWILPSIWR